MYCYWFTIAHALLRLARRVCTPRRNAGLDGPRTALSGPFDTTRAWRAARMSTIMRRGLTQQCASTLPLVTVISRLIQGALSIATPPLCAHAHLHTSTPWFMVFLLIVCLLFPLLVSFLFPLPLFSALSSVFSPSLLPTRAAHAQGMWTRLIAARATLRTSTTSSGLVRPVC